MAVTCARCGTPNSEGNQYCQSCGTPLAAMAAAPAAPGAIQGPPAGVAFPGPPPSGMQGPPASLPPPGYQSPYVSPLSGPGAMPPVHRTPWAVLIAAVV